MTLSMITITGADDAVDPHDLLDLSAEFDFVEWGILFSSSREGTPRYPSAAWVESLEEALASHAFMPSSKPGAPLRAHMHAGAVARFSAHFCGTHARATASGEWWPLEQLPEFFGRVQLNGIGAPAPTLVRTARAGFADIEFILQARTESEIGELFILASALPMASVLLDPSGGAGLVPSQRTAPVEELALFPSIRVGYAGGIAASNVVDVIATVDRQQRGAPYWLDMESGVRTNDRFDLALVRQVLETARPYVLHVGSR